MCMIGTEDYNNEIMIMNADSMIYDRSKEFNLNFFSEEWVNFCLWKNRLTGVIGGLNHNKRQEVAKLNIRNYNLQK